MSATFCFHEYIWFGMYCPQRVVWHLLVRHWNLCYKASLTYPLKHIPDWLHKVWPTSYLTITSSVLTLAPVEGHRVCFTATSLHGLELWRHSCRLQNWLPCELKM